LPSLNEPGKTKFTLSGVNVSIANSIRRTILSDLNTVVVRTTPHEKNDATFLVNTTRLNNEILGQRLSCIPVYLPPDEDMLKHLILELDITNITDSIIIVTTEHFRIKNSETGEYLSDEKVHEIFPPNNITNDYIEFVSLQPNVLNTSPGGHIHITATFSIASAKENAMFNVVSACSYGNTPDKTNITIESKNMLTTLAADQTKTKDERDMDFKNWKVLDSARIFLPDSFDFSIESLGVFPNKVIFDMACTTLINRILHIRNTIAGGHLIIRESDTTMKNCFDITLENEGYTLGKAFEFMLHEKFYKNAGASPYALTFCGFQKMHPHDSDCVIRVAYKTEQPATTVAQNMLECASGLMDLYKKCAIANK
jgi:DNA-directed RNA polymerase alpha subunit/DNA-directed RNA polymerase subunit L